MNCHNNNNNDKPNGVSFGHLLHLIICCGLPIMIIFSLPFIAKLSPAVASMLATIAPFICPIMMGGMIIMMFKRNKDTN